MKITQKLINNLSSVFVLKLGSYFWWLLIILMKYIDNGTTDHYFWWSLCFYRCPKIFQLKICLNNLKEHDEPPPSMLSFIHTERPVCYRKALHMDWISRSQVLYWHTSRTTQIFCVYAVSYTNINFLLRLLIMEILQYNLLLT